MAKRRKKSKAKGIATAVVVLIAVLVGLFFGKDAIFDGLTDKSSDPVSGGEVQFHFIDVGQGDAALIRTEKGDILIDAGTNSSKTFERMMDAIEAEKCGVIEATPDKTFTVGELTCTILAPISTSYTETNDYSVVIRADYGETSVLFTGDAETHSESEMLERYRFKGLLDCDILKAGHHGSDTSSSQAFLDAVTPVYAVISVGEGNTYGHPIQAILARYEAMKAEILRTDKEGDIVFTSTGGEPERK